MLSAKEIAARLGVSSSTVRRMAAAGELRHVRVGIGRRRTSRRFALEALDELRRRDVD